MIVGHRHRCTECDHFDICHRFFKLITFSHEHTTLSRYLATFDISDDACPLCITNDHHAVRELAPVHGINLGFPDGASTMLPKNPADYWNWAISLRKSDHSDGF